MALDERIEPLAVELDKQIESLSSIAPLRATHKKDHVVVEIENASIYHKSLYHAFLKALDNRENCQLGIDDLSRRIYKRLKPEIAQPFTDASVKLSVRAENFPQAVAKLYDIATSPNAVVERPFTEIILDKSIVDKFTMPEFFLFDEEQHVFKAQPHAFEPYGSRNSP